jgi:outer membrane protein assembly factor BamB
MSTETFPAVDVPYPVTPKKLRIWPAIPLVLYMLGAKIALPLLTGGESEPTFFLFQALIMGPLVCAAVIALWWLLASRARWRDRFLGLGGLVLLLVASQFIGDRSMRGMPTFGFIFPNTILAFGIAVILLSRLGSKICTLSALVVAALTCGYWELVRYDGMTGNLQSDIHWRWETSPEQKFLAELKAQPTPAPTATTEPLGKVTWPQFRGPNRDGIVPGVVLDVDWNARQPKQIWRHTIGPGWSSFAAAGNRLFTQEQRADKENVVCYDASSGEERWAHDSPGRFAEAMGGIGPRATPTLSGGLLYAQGATGLLQCLDPLTGAAKWERDLMKEAHWKKLPEWGYSSSPLVVGDTVIAYAPAGGQGQKTGMLLAFEATSGEPRWTAEAGGDSYSSPQLAQLAGRQVVLLLSNTGLAAVDPKTGKPAWNYDWPSEMHRVIQPLLVGDSGVLLGTGMLGGTRRIEVVSDKSDVKFEDRWTSMAIKPDFNDYVAFNGFLYGFDHDIFSCVDLATGEKKWKKGRYGNGQILLLPDAGQLLVLTEKPCELVLIRANPSKLDEVARHKVFDGKTWNHPVLVGNRVFVRNAEEAACFELPLAGQSTGDRTRAVPKEL